MTVLNPKTQIKRSDLLTTEECIELFGAPGAGGVAESQLVTFTTPYKMRLYERGAPKTQSRVRVHKKIVYLVESVFVTTLDVYGEAEIDRLGINVYAGSYEPRVQRGSKTVWSKHAFGIALDFLPRENGLRTRLADATFGKPEYKAWLDIWQKHGFANLGRALDYDPMHFEIMRIAMK